MASNTESRRYYLISYPRTASNLLLRILALDRQPSIISCGEFDGGYFFLPPDDVMQQLQLRDKHVSDWTAEEKAKVEESFQACFEAQQRCVEAAELQGKSVFVKEHTVFLAEPTARSRLMFGSDRAQQSPWTVKYAHGSEHSSLNFTILPDEYLVTWLPTFLIRHPALAFPSYYRTILEIEGKDAIPQDLNILLMTTKWSRSLYDFYVQRRHSLPCSPGGDDEWPIIVDADDTIDNPGVMTKLAERLNLDPKGLSFSWDQVGEKEQSKVGVERAVMRSTLYQSTGIIGDKVSRGINITDEANKWRSKFGASAAEYIEKLVREAMPDYEYLTERRLRA